MEEAQLYWQRTQTLLQGSEPPLVRHPKLTAALLQKPPFRFLHDVISEVQATTGFAAGLFQGAELDARQLQDREKRVAYLQKAFDAVGAALGVAIAANPAMVLAGADAESTNAFLQLLAQAARATSAARSGGLPHAGLGNVASIRVAAGLLPPAKLPPAAEHAQASTGPPQALAGDWQAHGGDSETHVGSRRPWRPESARRGPPGAGGRARAPDQALPPLLPPDPRVEERASGRGKRFNHLFEEGTNALEQFGGAAGKPQERVNTAGPGGALQLPDDLAMASELVHAVGQATALLGRDSERLVGGLAAAAAEQRAWRSERQALQAALAARAAAARAVTDLPGKAL
ncbi:hypothetical protein WJX81_002713 [Elliptochloris bilobata]|uniref:TRAF3-interacting protein 1 N-terminal domain-containing protein n=1 Tax=Elliptochloris bilobata TaxID=381761 RepID=A0AAW1QAQ8_9CHLO